MLDALMRRIGIVAHARADARNFIRRNARTHAASANHDPALHASRDQRFAHCFGEIRIVHRSRAVRAEVRHVVFRLAQERRKLVLQHIASMVRAHSDSHRLPHFPNSSLAVATTRSGMKPNFFCNSFRGADAPKVCIPMERPVGPTYRAQPIVDACSIEMRSDTSGGIALSRYSCG